MFNSHKTLSRTSGPLNSENKILVNSTLARNLRDPYYKYEIVTEHSWPDELDFSNRFDLFSATSPNLTLILVEPYPNSTQTWSNLTSNFLTSPINWCIISLQRYSRSFSSKIFSPPPSIYQHHHHQTPVEWIPTSLEILSEE